MTKPYDHCNKVRRYGQYNLCPLWGIGGRISVCFCVCWSSMQERASLAAKVTRYLNGDRAALLADGWTLKGAREHLKRLRKFR